MAYFFNNIIREHVSIFGSLFNDILIKHYDESENLVKEIKVPISYTNKDKFIQMYTLRGDNPDNYEDNVMLTVPRFGFEINDLVYNSEQKINRMNRYVGYRNNRDISISANTSIQDMTASMDQTIDSHSTNIAYSVFSPVPYKIHFNLYLITTKDTDSLQVFEQILPMFTPHVMIPVKYKIGTDIDLFFDEAITLEGVERQLLDNINFDKISKFIYTFTFSMDIKFFKNEVKEDTNRLIKHVIFRSDVLTGNNSIETVETVEFAAAPMPDKIIVNLEEWYDNFYNYMYHDLESSANTQILEKWY